jgi:CheY-like chemotaxis protein
MSYQVLIADDDAETRVLIKQALSEIESGIEITAVENGGEAVDRLASGGFDLVIINIQMPVTDYIEAVKVIHMSEPDLPILITTGVGDEDIKIETMQAGANIILSKPIDIKELKSEVKKLLDIRDKQ